METLGITSVIFPLEAIAVKFYAFISHIIVSGIIAYIGYMLAKIVSGLVASGSWLVAKMINKVGVKKSE